MEESKTQTGPTKLESAMGWLDKRFPATAQTSGPEETQTQTSRKRSCRRASGQTTWGGGSWQLRVARRTTPSRTRSPDYSTPPHEMNRLAPFEEKGTPSHRDLRTAGRPSARFSAPSRACVRMRFCHAPSLTQDRATV